AVKTLKKQALNGASLGIVLAKGQAQGNARAGKQGQGPQLSSATPSEGGERSRLQMGAEMR
ncbi:hypothetical protein FQA47_010275, partial [Oryzias melastigma]